MISRGADLNGANFTKGSGSSVYIADIDKYTDSQVFPGHVWDGFVDDGNGVNHIDVKNCNIFNYMVITVIVKYTVRSVIQIIVRNVNTDKDRGKRKS